ncbi:MAG: Ni/Fe hydrogenase subunit alpha [Candidatus Krumholzibacteria bacterium]|nr:Ni/Fe hydrogenase subunit alpha [Candidatus Krumholzibacteria bacterium]
MKRKIVVDHLCRVEGHGGITVELDGDVVSDVQFQVFEGLRLVEGLVRGRRYEDVSQIVSRICAICSVAHALTSLKATEEASGIESSPQTVRLRDLMYRGENIESHALHLFFLAIPDYLDYAGAAEMAADHREAVALGLRLKQLGNAIQETIGGRAVHPVNAILGGFGKLPSFDQLISLQRRLRQGMVDCEAAVDLFTTLPSTEYCQIDTTYAAKRSPDPYGYYPGDEIVVRSNEGSEVYDPGDYRAVIREETVPYSHAKLSLHKDKPFMVGALARLAIDHDRLSSRARHAVRMLGLPLPSGNPMDNNKAQMVELVIDVEHALLTVEQLIDEGLQQEKPIAIHPRADTGTAVTEAPRGLLIHSYTYDSDGRVVAADVVTPTAMNAASMENHFRHAVEQSVEKDLPELKRKLEMIARAYDPCISCSVHLVRKRHAI